MSANRREALTLLRFQIARREVSDAQRTLALLQSGYEDLQATVRDTDRILAAGAGRLAQLSRGARQAAPDIRDLREELNRAAEAQEEFNRQQQVEDGGRRGHFGLQRIGRLAANVPGLEGVAGGLNVADDIGDVVQILGTLSPAAIAAAGGIAVVGAGLVALEFSLRDAKEALNAATKANQFYFQVLRDLTSEQASQQLAGIRAQLEKDRAELANIEQAFAQATANASSGLEELLNALTRVSTVDDELTARADALRTAIADNAVTVGQLEAALSDGTTAANDAAAAELALAEARQASTDRQIQNEIRVLSNLNQTTDALDQRLAAIDREQEVLQDYLAAGGLSAELTQQLADRFTDLSAEESLLAIRMRPLIEEREREAAALAFQKQQLEEVRSALQSYHADVERIETKALQDRANAQDRFNKALVGAAEAAADAAEDALNRLLEKRQELARDFARDESDALAQAQLDQIDQRIEFQRDETRALRDHQRDLQDIIREAQREEDDLIANRDFAGLFRLRRDTGRRLEDANRQFNAERQDQLDAYRQQQQDAVDQYVREREQRQARYLQDLADATAQYQRELAQAEVNRRKALAKAAQAYGEELRLLGQKLTADLNARRQAYQAEIQLAAQSSQIRIQIMQKELQVAQQILASLGKGTSGGATAAGASGLSVPSAGNTTNIRGGASVSVTNNITGANNPDAIGRLIEQRVVKVLTNYLGAS